MFLGDLSSSEKSIFLSLAQKMISADDIFAPEEREMLEDISDEMKIDVQSSRSVGGSIRELCSSITDPEVQAKMMLELSSLAQIDEDFAETEKTLLEEVAILWSINPLALSAINEWGGLRVRLAHSAARVISEITSEAKGIG
jgi:hypothetical protein